MAEQKFHEVAEAYEVTKLPQPSSTSISSQFMGFAFAQMSFPLLQSKSTIPCELFEQ